MSGCFHLTSTKESNKVILRRYEIAAIGRPRHGNSGFIFICHYSLSFSLYSTYILKHNGYIIKEYWLLFMLPPFLPYLLSSSTLTTAITFENTFLFVTMKTRFLKGPLELDLSLTRSTPTVHSFHNAV